MTVFYIMHTELMSLLLQKNSLHKIACNILPETILTLLNICYIIYSIMFFYLCFGNQCTEISIYQHFWTDAANREDVWPFVLQSIMIVYLVFRNTTRPLVFVRVVLLGCHARILLSTLFVKSKSLPDQSTFATALTLWSCNQKNDLVPYIHVLYHNNHPNIMTAKVRTLSNQVSNWQL